MSGPKTAIASGGGGNGPFAPVNIYNSDGTLLAGRTITGAGHDVVWSDINLMLITSFSLPDGGLAVFNLEGQQFETSGSSGGWVIPGNLSQAIGGFHNIAVSGTASWAATIMSIATTSAGELRLATPNVQLVTAVLNQVPKLQDITTGLVEYGFVDFIELGDAPSAYGNAYQLVGANATPDGLEFKAVYALPTGEMALGFFPGTTSWLQISSDADHSALQIIQGPEPDVLTTGDVWNDSTQQALALHNFGLTSYLSGSIFSGTANTTVGNTTTETTLISTGIGTLTIPAFSWAPGKMIRISMRGFITDTGTPAFRVRAKIGGTTVSDSGGVSIATITGTQNWRLDCIITCRTIGTTGKFFVQTIFDYATANAAGMRTLAVPNTAEATIDTEADQTLDITAQWGTTNPSNTLTATNLLVEWIN